MNSEYNKRYYREHKAQVSASVHRYYVLNRTRRLARDREYYQTHRSHILAMKRKYYQAHKPRILAYNNLYRQRRYWAEPRFRLRKSVSDLIGKRLKKRLSGKRGESSFGILPYTLDDLMRHLESRFKLGMGWNNYGAWQIDHIRPDCLFDYKSPADGSFQECWALGNLQPLWIAENNHKGGRLQ